MKFRFIFAMIVAFVSVAAAVPATAQQDDESIAIQLKSLGLPAISQKGYRGRTTITPYIEVIDEDAVERFCGRLPRVLDAILIAFEENPVILENKTTDLAGRQDELGRHIEEAVGIGVFKRLHLVAGSKRRGAGSELVSLRSGTRECQPIAYLPWEKPSPQKPVEITESIFDAKADAAVAEESAAEVASPQAEATVEEPVRELPAKSFPAPPVIASGPSWVVITIALIAMSGFTIVFGSYIGYQVAKIRRDRRRKERRMKKDRRSGLERRLAQGPLPEEGERRSGKDRRSGIDRRDVQDRRSKRDRREDATENKPD